MTTLLALQNADANYAVFRFFRTAMFTESLTKLGLSEKEAMLYLMLLRNGPSPVSSLARRTQMKRVSLYSVLDSLTSRGLATFEQSKTGRRYIAHDPECLLYLLEKQNAELKYKMELAKDCIEKLQEPLGQENFLWQRIVFHKGRTAVQKHLDETVSRKSPLYVLFFNYGEVSPSALCLEEFLLKPKRQESIIYLCLPNQAQGKFERLGALYQCCYFEEKTTRSAQLLLQEDQLFFIFTKEHDVELMVVRDADYSSYVKEILFARYF